MSKVLVDRNVLEQALDSLEYIRSTTVWQADKHAANPAINALKAALALALLSETVAINCQAKRDNGGVCPHHNLQCGWPDCNKPQRIKLEQPEPVPLGPHPDTVRLAYLYSGTQTSSDALVNAEMKLLNGETVTLEEARAAIDDAMSKPMKY